MDKTNVEFLMNTKLYNQMDEICEDLGMSVDDAFQVFARKMVNEQGIPFEVTEKEYPSNDEEHPVLKILGIFSAVAMLCAAIAGIVALVKTLKQK